jgi:hypothetical protein
MAETLIALYDDFDNAREMVEELVENGYYPDDITVIANDVSGEYARLVRELDVRDSVEDVSAAEGASFGAVVGTLVGLGAAIIPGIGPVLAAGPLAAALTGGVIGAAAGAATGGLVAGLIDMEMPEEEAGYYAEGVRRGGTLVLVNALNDEQADEVLDIMEAYDPVDIDERVGIWRETGWNRFEPNTDPYTLEQIRQERMNTRSRGF